MHIELSVSGQRLRREMGPGIVGGSRYYLTAHVAFAGTDWDGAQVWLRIDQDGAQNAYLLDEAGCVTADRGINLPSGQYTMSLLGIRDNMRITTNEVPLCVLVSGADGGDPLPEIPQTAAEQIALLAQEAVDTARSVREDADAGDFNGAPGKNGVSAEHKWNGSVLTITSASGTSSADLRGPQGPQGVKGQDAPQDAVRYGEQALDEAQKAKARGNIGAASDAELSRVKDDMTALAPAGAAVGQLFRVAAISEDGKYTMEPVDMPTVPVKDVTVAGASVVNDGVANVPNATNNAKGVVRGNTSIVDSNFAVSGGSPYCMTRNASDFYSQGASGFVSIGTLRNVLKAPSLMPSLTAEEQTAARVRMGLVTDTPFELVGDVMTEEVVKMITLTLSKQCRCVSITFTIPPESAGNSRNVYFTADANPTVQNAFCGCNNAKTSETNKAEYRSAAEIIGGRIFSGGGISAEHNTGVDYQQRGIYGVMNGFGVLEADCFTQITVLTYGADFPAGSKVQIYGC